MDQRIPDPGGGPARRAAPGGQPDTERAARLLSFGGIVAALGAASCCMAPFLLFTLGVSGAWIGNLTALHPYQPIFAAVALGCIGFGVWRMRRPAPIACADGYCGTKRADRVARIGLWTAAILVVVAVAFPYVLSALMAS